MTKRSKESIRRWVWVPVFIFVASQGMALAESYGSTEKHSLPYKADFSQEAAGVQSRDQNRGSSNKEAASQNHTATSADESSSVQTRLSNSSFFGQWRYVYHHMQDFPLNSSGDKNSLGWYLDQRLDVGVEQDVSDSLGFVAELEFFYGQVAGQFDHLAAGFRTDAREHLPGWDLKNAELRQLWLHWKTPWFMIRAGQMGSNWGFGLLANDGRPTPGRLGIQAHGDLSDRVILATRPLATAFPKDWAGRLVTAIGGGLVYRDENSSLRDGDVAGEGLFSVFYPGDELWAGLYVAGRFAEDLAGTKLNVVAIDFHAKWEPKEGDSGLLVGAEIVYAVGLTNRVITASRPDGLDVSAFGAVARLGWVLKTWGLRPLVEVGFASGDPNPHDDTVTTFSFDPDYKVGLVLFDTVMRSLSAMAVEESADPQRVGTAVQGTEQLATSGRVSNAFYVYPQLSLRPIEPLSVMVAVLFARSVSEFSQAYQTFANGGVPTNAFGKLSPGRELGWEFDIGADWDQPLWNDLHLLAGLQAGWFFPGAAFEREDGNRPGIMARLLARVALNW